MIIITGRGIKGEFVQLQTHNNISNYYKTQLVYSIIKLDFTFKPHPSHPPPQKKKVFNPSLHKYKMGPIALI